jgi:hypothetical protein
MATMFRQGDVLLVKVERAPKNLHPRLPVKAGIVLAYGEVTGHAHVLDPEKVRAFVPNQTGAWDASAERYIQVLEKTALQHLDLPAGGVPTGEHADIALEPGMYQVIRQREWDDSMETRYVSD